MTGYERLFGDHAALLAGGTSAFLLLGCALMAAMRSPAHRQRLGELTLAAIFAWLPLACLPLPRLLPHDFWKNSLQAPVQDTASDASVEFSPDIGVAPDEAPWQDGEIDDQFVSAGNDQRLARPTDVDSELERAHGNDVVATMSPLAPTRPIVEAIAEPAASDWISPLVAAYLIGAALCMAWLLCGRIRLFRVRRNAQQPPVWLAELFASLSDEGGRRPRLLVSDKSARPISWGTRRPIIVLPATLVRRRDRERLRMVLLHELGHVARRDSWGNVLICLGFPLLYVHPLFWWLRGQVRLAAELLADDWAACRAGKLAYVEQLVALARMSPTGVVPLAGAVTLYSSPSQFYRRMQMLIVRNGPLAIAPSVRWRLTSLAGALLVVVLAAAVGGVRPAAGQPAPGVGGAPAEIAPTVPPPTEKPASAEKPAEAPKPADPTKPETPPKPTEPKASPAGPGLLEAPPVVGPPSSRGSEEQLLRERLAAAQRDIAALEERLRALTASSTANPKLPATAVPAPPSNTVVLTRVNEDGSISTEQWSIGEDGKPSKIISKNVHESGDSPFATAKPPVVVGERVVKEYTKKDGAVVRQYFDKNSGRLMVAHESVGPPAMVGGGNPPSTQPVPQPPRPMAERGSHAPGGLDLVSLATAYADALTNVESAQARYAAAESAHANKVISATELKEAQLVMQSAKRKYQLLRNIASVAADSAKAEFQRTQHLVQSGAASADAAAEAGSRWKMLTVILDSDPSSASQEPAPDQAKQ
ncbi:MAG TPA: M56 family metallopeptidase [Pirellulales bacterium]|nr:M56 family metallopeptidase [Pirellulales bacterium]